MRVRRLAAVLAIALLLVLLAYVASVRHERRWQQTLNAGASMMGLAQPYRPDDACGNCDHGECDPDAIHVLSEGRAFEFGHTLLQPIVERALARSASDPGASDAAAAAGPGPQPQPKVVWHHGDARSARVPYSLVVRGPFLRDEPAMQVGDVPTLAWSGESYDPDEPVDRRAAVSRLRSSTVASERRDTHFPFMLFKSLGDGAAPRRADPDRQPRPRFLAYMSSNCQSNREALFRALARLRRGEPEPRRPTALGRCSGGLLPNRAPQPGTWEDTHTVYAQYRFVVAMENSDVPGYVTEKIVNAFEAGAVPVFWGDTALAARTFNPDAYVDVGGFPTVEAAAAAICRVDDDPEAYARYARAPMMHPALVAQGIDTWEKLKSAYVRRAVLDLRAALRPTSLGFVSFGVDGAKRMSLAARRIEAEARRLPTVFSRVTVHSSWPAWALEPQHDAYRRVARGAGLWFWKPRVVLDELLQLQHGSMLLYADSGCEIQGGAATWRRYTDLAASDADVVVFRVTGFPERGYTKAGVLRALGASPVDAATDQLAATALLVRRNDAVVSLLRRWWASVQRPELLADDDGQPAQSHRDFVAHRHDQSLWSLLVKAARRDGTLNVAVRDIRETEARCAPLRTSRRVA